MMDTLGVSYERREAAGPTLVVNSGRPSGRDRLRGGHSGSGHQPGRVQTDVNIIEYTEEQQLMDEFPVAQFEIPAGTASEQTLPERMDRIERNSIAATLSAQNGSLGAHLRGPRIVALDAKMQKHGLRREEFAN